MSIMEIGKEIVALCQQGKNLEAIEKFYSPDIVSVEAFSMPGMDQTQTGIEAIKAKNKWFGENHEVHSAEIRGPFPHGERFTLFLNYDVTPKHTGQRMTMEEIGLYTVENGKVTKEEFFFGMPDCS